MSRQLNVRESDAFARTLERVSLEPVERRVAVRAAIGSRTSFE
jgi:hypothetical protein